MTEVLEGRASRLTDLSCLEVPASQAEQGRNLREPGEARWDKTSRQVTSPHLSILTGGVWRGGRLWWRNQGRAEDQSGIPSGSDSRGVPQLSILLLRLRYAVNIRCHHINIVLTELYWCEV